MNITIDQNLQSTLARLAAERNLTVEQYTQNFIENHLRSQYREFIVNKIHGSAPDVLVQFETVIEAKRAEIQETEEAKIVPGDNVAPK